MAEPSLPGLRVRPCAVWIASCLSAMGLSTLTGCGDETASLRPAATDADSLTCMGSGTVVGDFFPSFGTVCSVVFDTENATAGDRRLHVEISTEPGGCAIRRGQLAPERGNFLTLSLDRVTPGTVASGQSLFAACFESACHEQTQADQATIILDGLSDREALGRFILATEERGSFRAVPCDFL